MSNDAAAKKKLRENMRMRRRSLANNVRDIYAHKLFQRLIKTYSYKTAKNIALYLPNDGEISLHLLIKLAWRTNKNVFLPVVKPNKQMVFSQFKRGDKLIRNKYKILEPQKKSTRIKTQQLDLVLVPLVAFDKYGNRLGMGGGYYDRAFSFKRNSIKTKPVLFGVAYDFQCCDALPTESWDISVSTIVTDKGKYGCISTFN